MMSSDILEEMDLLDTFAPDTPPQVGVSAGGSVMVLRACRRIACPASDTMHLADALATLGQITIR